MPMSMFMGPEWTELANKSDWSQRYEELTLLPWLAMDPRFLRIIG